MRGGQGADSCPPTVSLQSTQPAGDRSDYRFASGSKGRFRCFSAVFSAGLLICNPMQFFGRMNPTPDLGNPHSISTRGESPVAREFAAAISEGAWNAVDLGPSFDVMNLHHMVQAIVTVLAVINPVVCGSILTPTPKLAEAQRRWAAVKVALSREERQKYDIAGHLRTCEDIGCQLPPAVLRTPVNISEATLTYPDCVAFLGYKRFSVAVPGRERQELRYPARGPHRQQAMEPLTARPRTRGRVSLRVDRCARD